MQSLSCRLYVTFEGDITNASFDQIQLVNINIPDYAYAIHAKINTNALDKHNLLITHSHKNETNSTPVERGYFDISPEYGKVMAFSAQFFEQNNNSMQPKEERDIPIKIPQLESGLSYTIDISLYNDELLAFIK